ncbi:MAG: oxidoreductase [Bacteroidetes bacterium]|nr:MAG: oxidoreductase [Bacteroidota bacterium]
MASRRKFLANSSKAALALGISQTIPSSVFSKKAIAPSDKINIALIGARSMGFGNLQNALKQTGVECAAICDIDDSILKQRIADVVKIQGKSPRAFKDFRKLLDQKDIDAVIIGTPDHWHCLQTIMACEAGKDVYVEKPLANSIGECDLMVKAVRKYNRVVQVGQQQRSGDHWKQAMDFIKTGNIGKLRKVNVWGNFNYGIGQPIVPDEAIPAGVDFDMWLGPAPQRSFNKSRFHGSWRMFWDYGGGLITDWGVHLLDMALWVKDIKDTPLAVSAVGGNYSFADHAHETFDTMSVNFQMKDYNITWEHTAGTQNGPYGRSYGLAYIGDKATLVIDRDGWELFPEIQDGKPLVPVMPKQPGHDNHEEHMKNFLECMKSRRDPNCPIENGRLVALYAHAGNLALKTNSRLVWDENSKSFINNSAANAHLLPVYRSPWKIPVV